MDFPELEMGTGIVGVLAFVFPAAIAVATFFVLRRELQIVRIVGAVLAFMFPFVGVVGLVLYPRIRPKLAGFSTQVHEAVQAARKETDRASTGGRTPDAQAQVLQALRGRIDQLHVEADKQVDASHARHAPLDPIRLLSSDISVRFGAAAGADRKLNIPKVVE